jgi:hypothetical protein
MPTVQTVNQYYEIVSPGIGSDEEDFYIRVDIQKGPLALSGASEEQILGFVRNYLQSLTPNPIRIARIQTIRTDDI